MGKGCDYRKKAQGICRGDGTTVCPVGGGDVAQIYTCIKIHGIVH